MQEGDIVIGRYVNGECYLCKVMRYSETRRAVIVEYCNPQKSTGLFYLDEVVQLTDQLVEKLPVELQPTAKDFLERKKLMGRV